MFHRAIIAAAFIPLAGCSEVPSSSPAGGMAALEACKRADVQDAVGKEARSIVFKKASLKAWWRPSDFDGFAQEFENASVTFSSTALQSGVSADSRTIGCMANFKFDASNATKGQDVVQVTRLKWTIRFADDHPDPASSNFTIKVDPSSLFEDIAINGERVQDLANREAREQAEQQERSQAAEAESDQAPSPPSPATSNEDPASEPNVRKQPSPEELYAPEL